MFELIYKDGTKTFAKYIEDLGWFDLEGFKLRDDGWVWCRKLS